MSYDENGRGSSRQRRPSHAKAFEFQQPEDRYYDKRTINAWMKLNADDRWRVEMSLDHYYRLRRMPCYLCGTLLEGSGWKDVGWIDRLDNARPYTEDNARPCCPKCNFGKFKMSAEQFVEHCRRVTEWQKCKELIDGRVEVQENPRDGET